MEPDVIADNAEGDRASLIDLENRELPTTKTLGVLLAATDDKYFFRHLMGDGWIRIGQEECFEENSNILRPTLLLVTSYNQVQVVDTKRWDWDKMLSTHHQRQWTKFFQNNRKTLKL